MMGDPHRYQILVVHPNNEYVLVLDDKKLPSLSYRGSILSHLDQLCNFVKTKLNLLFDVILLRSECAVPSDRIINKKALLIFDIPDDQLPYASSHCKPWQWMPKAEVSGISLEPPIPVVSDYLQKYSIYGLNINSARLRPSSKPGWFKDTRKWTIDVLSRAGYEIRAVVQMKSTPASSMLVATTQCSSKFYIKAVAPGGMNNEAGVTVAISKIMPNICMRPFAVDEKSQFLLMKDYGPSMPDDCELADTDPKLFRKVLSAWAEIQRESISKREEFLQQDLPVIDEEGLRREIENMFEDPEWWIAQQEGMKEEDKARYEESEYKQLYLRYVEGLCRKISEYQVPLALVHGDLNAVNCIARGDSEFVFIDFAHTCWSFPFVDAAGFAFIHGADRNDLDFYLEFWSDYESLDKLRELLLLADKVCDVNAVLLSYQRYVDAEESDRMEARENILIPVCRAFSRGFEF